MPAIRREKRFLIRIKLSGKRTPRSPPSHKISSALGITTRGVFVHLKQLLGKTMDGVTYLTKLLGAIDERDGKLEESHR